VPFYAGCTVAVRYLYNKTKLPVVAHNRYWSVALSFICACVAYVIVITISRGGFNGRPLVQWPTGPLALEAPGREARQENNGSCIEFMIYLMILPQNH